MATAANEPFATSPMREFWQLNTTSEVWRDLYVWFPMIYTAPSLFLYFIIFYELICGGLAKKSPFYKLFCVCMIIDLTTWFGFFFWVRATRSPMMFSFYSLFPKDGSFPQRVILFCVFYGFYGQIISSTALNLNRWTVFAIPTKHEKLWRRITWPLIIFTCISPLFFMNYMFTIPLRVTFFDDRPQYYELAFVHEPNINNALAQLILGVISDVAVILMNFHSIYYMKLRRKQAFSVVSRQQSERCRHEIKLLGVSLLIFVNRISIDVIQLLFYLHNPNVVRYLFDIQRYFMDLSCLSPPWYILLMSSQIRQRVWGWMPGQRNQTQTKNLKKSPVTVFAIVKKTDLITTPRTQQNTISTLPTINHSSRSSLPTHDQLLDPNVGFKINIFKLTPAKLQVQTDDEKVPI